jgi:dipeptidyl aminopeptidase/acylaminoacyl peptidase
VKRHFALLAAALVGVLVLAGQLARAAPPGKAALPGNAAPNDSLPYWSWDARQLAFQRQSPRADNGHVLFSAAGHGDETDVVGTGRARGWRPAGSELLVQLGAFTTIRDAADRQIGSVPGTDATWSPDGGKIAFLQGDSLYVADATGSNPRLLRTGISPPAPDLTGPVWSPDGSEVAIAAATSATTSAILAVKIDGSEDARVLFDGAGDNVNPSWSPDNARIAFERDYAGPWAIWFVAPDGTEAHEAIGGGADNRFPQFGKAPDRLAFISDRQHIPGEASQYRYALYVQVFGESRAVKLLDDVHPSSPAKWSPTGAQLAVAAGQECLRWGIYVVESETPGQAHRRSNQCRFEGGAGNDTVNGTPYFDILGGLGGNDFIVAGAGNDRIEGGPGNDRVAAGPGNDSIFGGPGNDILSGGNGNDTIVAGPGIDKIGCGPGNDTAYVGPGDTVRDCEHVRKS